MKGFKLIVTFVDIIAGGKAVADNSLGLLVMENQLARRGFCDNHAHGHLLKDRFQLLALGASLAGGSSGAPFSMANPTNDRDNAQPDTAISGSFYPNRPGGMQNLQVLWQDDIPVLPEISQDQGQNARTAAAQPGRQRHSGVKSRNRIPLPRVRGHGHLKQ